MTRLGEVAGLLAASNQVVHPVFSYLRINYLIPPSPRFEREGALETAHGKGCMVLSSMAMVLKLYVGAICSNSVAGVAEREGPVICEGPATAGVKGDGTREVESAMGAGATNP